MYRFSKNVLAGEVKMGSESRSVLVLAKGRPKGLRKLVGVTADRHVIDGRCLDTRLNRHCRCGKLMKTQ